jgi:serine protease DegQ
MTSNTLELLSNEMADAVAAAADSVVQVRGRRGGVSGVAYSDSAVVTSARALGREDRTQVTTADGRTAAAELSGWDPASGLAVLRVEGLALKAARLSTATPRVGQIALAIGRSWSNALTASAGTVAVIGGPLKTGRGYALQQIIRITAPLHEGFAGGAVVDAGGALIAIATAAKIRGFAVTVPAGIAWQGAAHVLEHGRPKLGYLGLSGQTVALPERQRAGGGTGMLVTGVAAGGPAATAGVLIGDVVIGLDDQPVKSIDDLLALLAADRVGRAVPLHVLRGGAALDVTVTVAERRAS